MNKAVETVGNIAGVAGAVVCVVSGGARVFGTWNVAGMQIAALFNLGIGLMVFACLSKLHVLASK